MSYKAITQNSYEATAQEFARNVEDLAPLESIERFITLLPPEAKIIDIGCGSGRDAKIFTEKNLSVLGIDFSANLLDIAKSHAPLANFQLMDIEKAHFPADSFDGAWACCSLSHIDKQRLPAILNNIHSFLKEKGIFYLTLKQGKREGLEVDSRYEGNFEKFWAYFEEDELKQMVQSANFKVLNCRVVHVTAAYHTHPCIRIFCQKE